MSKRPKLTNSAQAAGAPIPPDSKDYPKYTVRYAGGELVPSDGEVHVAPVMRVAIGPHGFVLNMPKNHIKIAIAATQNESKDGSPDISITFSVVA